jgi:hypothetical protein
VNPSDRACSGNIHSERDIANLYTDGIVSCDTHGMLPEILANHRQLCSNCFIRMLYYRVTSNYLPDADYSQNLVDQSQDIADVCSTSILDVTLRALPAYDPTPTKTHSPTSAAPVATCSGQTISSSSVPAQCDAKSTKYGVSTKDIQSATNSDTYIF